MQQPTEKPLKALMSWETINMVVTYYNATVAIRCSYMHACMYVNCLQVDLQTILASDAAAGS